MTEPAAARTYLIGPLERRGMLLGLRAGHVVLAVLCALAVVAVFNILPDVVGLVVALVLVTVAATAALLPIGGRALDEWALVAVRHAAARTLGTTTWVSQEARGGQRFVSTASWTGAEDRDPDGDAADASDTWIGGVRRVDGRRSVPPYLRGVELWTATWGDGEIGVVRDREWERWTAVVAVRGRSFALVDRAEKEARLDEWARVLSSLARENSPLVRLQWIERTVPDDSEGVVRDFADRRVQDLESPAVRSYLTLLDRAAPATQQHELYLALTVGAREAHRAVRRLGRGRELAVCEVLAHEIDGAVQAIGECGLTVLGVLGVRPLAQLLRVALDPVAEEGLAHRAAADPTWTGALPSDAFPQASEEDWGELRADGAHHRTYWVSEWPRSEVGADLMVPLLLRTTRRRTVSVVIAVDSPSRAMRRTEAQRRGDETTERARERLGFSSGARRQREHEGAMRREQELASGHAHLRFSAYITVSGRTRAELEAGCADVERQARSAGLEVRPEYGMQACALTFTLPLGRGLR